MCCMLQIILFAFCIKCINSNLFDMGIWWWCVDGAYNCSGVWCVFILFYFFLENGMQIAHMLGGLEQYVSRSIAKMFPFFLFVFCRCIAIWNTLIFFGKFTKILFYLLISFRSGSHKNDSIQKASNKLSTLLFFFCTDTSVYVEDNQRDGPHK